MKLLCDQNLSYKLTEMLKDTFDVLSHVKHHDLTRADDMTLFEFARKNEFTIVTQDSDLYDIALIKGIPPKIIWLRLVSRQAQSLGPSLVLFALYFVIKRFT